jgi:hypothetical protein
VEKNVEGIALVFYPQQDTVSTRDIENVED